MIRTSLCVVAVLFLSAVPVISQKEKRKPRIFNAPEAYYKAEAFIELNDADRMLYTAGLMDGFFASAFFGATQETVDNLTSCTKDMDNMQTSAIITKYVKDHPENWHLPLSTQAFNALNTACPGHLKIIEGKN